MSDKQIDKIYLVSSLKKTIGVNVLGREINLDCSDLADGCVGVSLWFDSETSAKDYGGSNADLLTATIEVEK